MVRRGKAPRAAVRPGTRHGRDAAPVEAVAILTDNDQTGEPVLAHPQTAGYRLRKFVVRRKRSVALAAALAVA